MVSKIVIGLFAVLSLFTTGMVISKVLSSTSVPKINNNVDVSQNLPEPTVTKPVVSTIKILPKATSSADQCIVAISGQKYNVTALQTSHSGGDIFDCGTDMTKAYTKKHGSSLSLIKKYLIGNVTNEIFPTSTKNLRGEEDDD